MYKKIIPIILCYDNNYVVPSAVAIHSLLKNADTQFLYKFHVLHSDISEVNQSKLKHEVGEFENAEIEFHIIESDLDSKFEMLNSKGHYSKEMFYKLIVGSLFPQYEKVIITDVDVVFCGDVSLSYINFDVESEYYVAGIQSVSKMSSHMDIYKSAFEPDEISIIEQGIGAGYCVFNLKRIRKDNLEDRFFDCLEKNINRLIQPEQDVINLCTYKKQQHMHLKYMVCSYMYDLYNISTLEDEENFSQQELLDALKQPVQLHFATSTKPWSNLSCTKSELWLSYLLKTQFYRDYLIAFHTPKKERRKPVFSIKIPYKSEKFFEFKLEKIKRI
jgi:lipopolysaccharide biosynthesis glycosyltransferase